ncbi:Cof-type HAD-IIB family hydrolase [Paenibacillus sp. CAA11]|uniref:Cof-type HAD-IIB family hydrolase n=1 Tax=Paenibacillus sp. CAA11 TaxID=1532905 RepID=UPI000D371BC1|nr:Cof-type HAD-IIB family hydrolase [Paenibacillus sp. CAA11]AWB44177.1 Cof-type HAD-IIB family hydrolase [Paenibacillus sp. CAA11]
MKYKLIALDVDGTLLNDDHVLTQGTKEVIAEVAAQGTEIVLCTGRAPSGSIPYMESLGLEGYIITHNGAAAVTVGSTREVVHEFAMNAQGLEPYFDYCRKHGVHFDVNTTFELYTDRAEELDPEILEMYHKFLVHPKSMPAWSEFHEPIVKITASGTPEAIDKVQQDWGLWEQEFNMLRSGDYFLDLMHKEASKGAALKKLAEKRGIAPEEVMAIGNYYNDITMLTFAGLGVAMENSPLEVKAAADAITLTNNEEGVKAALEKYCLEISSSRS